MSPILLKRSLIPDVISTMFRCDTCGFWYHLDSKGPNGYCRQCYWGLQPDMKTTIKRKAVVLDLARIVEKILATQLMKVI